MTTIVYHDGIIAYDSMYTDGETITSSSGDKKTCVKSVNFFFTGCVCDQKDLVNAYFDESFNNKADIGAFIVDNGMVFLAGISNTKGFWMQEIIDITHCIGTGSDHAWTAVDMGCDAKGAVKMAIKRDVYSGGKVRTYKVVRTRNRKAKI